ncbi:16S rRNA (uracil1498-N3)-methyltransferase [Ekhidna lutea]|uniref:Ribosomal RNA small subunit methyltransferase E n=1 Tax=Ekhidna lutea TaxID=447679 RepID=A0A239L4R4_EKHLU|nr:16S rRNA (uracil(1498)-N(3))-methyltransferase [Ekhidna lutea]SNT25300.1 16S rRNA (uracil1498-N3)-methyltransferase [Ekhidna lutea]
MTIFYKNDIIEGPNALSEEESKHCALVLRHKKGDEIQVFDGKGNKHVAVLTQIHKKACEFEIIRSETSTKKPFSIHLAIAPTKNMDRMEWLVEKLSETGVDEVTFIQTQNSERKKLRIDRLEKKAISAMKQSGNPFLLKLNDLTPFDQLIDAENNNLKLIAHVDHSYKYIQDILIPKKSTTILIGPEGDFSLNEIEQAKKAGFQATSLGENTLRTETAGFVACCAVNLINKF